MNGLFFVLGSRFKRYWKQEGKAPLTSLYQGMCVASHGMVHKSHAKYKKWKTSILDTKKLLVETIPQYSLQNYYFRPPYGQRTSEAWKLLEEQSGRIMLWNLDSQDWNRKITAHQTADRLISLMLLWRRGIVLFHDVYPKAQESLSIMLQSFRGSGVNWMDCHQPI